MDGRSLPPLQEVRVVLLGHAVLEFEVLRIKLDRPLELFVGASLLLLVPRGREDVSQVQVRERARRVHLRGPLDVFDAFLFTLRRARQPQTGDRRRLRRVYLYRAAE